ncbi:hypothetical protein [Botrimarina sp.]|uniref:hypothetical protein n=1 Tax=Botrimarina sp. TaxID=2795802 RepID=UPI0032F00031
MRCLLTLLVAALLACQAPAETFDLATATDLFVPSFRGGDSSTHLGWDTFGAPGAAVIDDATPDIGSGSGSFVTTNGEDHQSGSLNYYSGGGSVAEDVSFVAEGADGNGFTTVIVQAITLFGDWGVGIQFGPIAGVAPKTVLQTVNAAGAGQLFVKYELPGVGEALGFSMASGPMSFTSFDRFVIDAVWSPTGYAADDAIATPEPTSGVLALGAALIGAALRPR